MTFRLSDLSLADLWRELRATERVAGHESPSAEAIRRAITEKVRAEQKDRRRKGEPAHA